MVSDRIAGGGWEQNGFRWFQIELGVQEFFQIEFQMVSDRIAVQEFFQIEFQIEFAGG